MSEKKQSVQPLATRAQAGRLFDEAEEQILATPRDRLQKALQSKGFLSRYGILCQQVFEKLLIEFVDNTFKIRPRLNLSSQELLTLLEDDFHQLVGDRDVVERVVAEMPTTYDKKGEVEFFHIGKESTDEEVATEAMLRGFSRMATPYELASINMDDSNICDIKPNATIWKDNSNRWCHIYFIEHQFLASSKPNGKWANKWWFAAIR